MNPVQYMIHLIEQGKSYADAYSHASQRFGMSKAQLEQAVIDARAEACDLIRAIDGSRLLA